MVDVNTFVFLGQRGTLSGSNDWNDPSADKLWLYNLHYFDDLNAFDAPTRESWHTALIDRWVEENQIGVGNGWEPYPMSLRIVNWIKFSLRGHQLSKSATGSLAQQVRYLAQRLEKHILGNHLLANAKALIFAGCYFTGEEADAWLAEGLRILGEQAAEQVLDDGAHFELSPMYHCIVLTDFLDLTNVAHCFGLKGRLPRLRVSDMLDWSAAMSHPDGKISFFNDSAFGIAAEHAELCAYATRLGEVADREGSLGSVHLASSGYLRLENDAAVMLVDAAPVGPTYLPAHAHADTLSFELSLGAQRILVNGGTSRYGTSQERHAERSTMAHNTLVIDGENSSEVWSGFRVARRARPRVEQVQLDGRDHQSVTAWHDGYRRLPGRNIHRRTWTLGEGSLVVEDHVSGPFRTVEIFFHLHPDAGVRLTDRGADIFLDGQVQVELTVEEAILRCEPDQWHPEFGAEISSHVLVARALGASVRCRFNWTFSS